MYPMQNRYSDLYCACHEYIVATVRTDLGCHQRQHHQHERVYCHWSHAGGIQRYNHDGPLNDQHQKRPVLHHSQPQRCSDGPHNSKLQHNLPVQRVKRQHFIHFLLLLYGGGPGNYCFVVGCGDDVCSDFADAGDRYQLGVLAEGGLGGGCARTYASAVIVIKPYDIAPYFA